MPSSGSINKYRNNESYLHIPAALDDLITFQTADSFNVELKIKSKSSDVTFSHSPLYKDLPECGSI